MTYDEQGIFYGVAALRQWQVAGFRAKVFSVAVFPTFSDVTLYAILDLSRRDGPPAFAIQRNVWKYRKPAPQVADAPQPAKAEIRTDGCEASPAQVDTWKARLTSIHVPFGHVPPPPAFDGVTYELVYGDKRSSVQLRWYLNGPSEWSAPVDFANEFLMAMERQEWTPRMVGE